MVLLIFSALFRNRSFRLLFTVKKINQTEFYEPPDEKRIDDGRREGGSRDY
jgi:hypothetical protein